MKHSTLFLSLCAGFAACGNADVAAVHHADAGNLYFDYQIWAEEGSDEATVRLQYKAGGAGGRGVAVKEPGQVLLDSVPLVPDSTKFSGAYYELREPVAQLQGKHAITLVDENGLAHREVFSLTPFELAEELPEEIPQKPFDIALKNFPAAPTKVRVVLIDTSLESPGVNEVLVVNDGRLTISDAMLMDLAKGPVTMEISLEDEQPIGRGTKSRGKLLVNYGIRRQFQLVD